MSQEIIEETKKTDSLDDFFAKIANPVPNEKVRIQISNNVCVSCEG